MNKIQLRKKRIRLKAERMEILRKIDELQTDLDTEKNDSKRREIRIEINRLGELLQSKVITSVSDHGYATHNIDFQDYATGKRKAWSMPVNKYIKYKKRGLSDKEIAAELGATTNQIYSWKKRNGITKEMWLQEAN